METSAAERLCDRAVHWLYDVREHFALPRDIPADLVDVHVFKALSELGLACWIVRREGAAGSGASQAAAALLDFVWSELGDGELLYRMQLRNPAATHPIEAYSIMYAAGYRHAGLHAFAGHLAGLRSYQVPEHVPNRRLGLAAAIRRLGLTPRAELGGLAGETWLGGTPEPWMLDTFSAYALTHTVFHLTDHGADRGGLPPDLREYLHRWLPVWLDVYAESGFWDLLGELLIVHSCAAAPVHDLAPWHRFVQAQLESGMTPNGINRPTADPAEAARQGYHSTVVATITGTLVASRGLGAALTPAG
jgi:hypothetical protein